jgi:PPOX class probable F420-dependent enzyme
MLLDTSSEFGARVERKLHEELVIWFTAVDEEGTPQPNPVWFVWQDGSFLTYCQPGSRRLNHIDANPRVALHLNTDRDGSEVVVFTGLAHVDTSAPPAHQVREYMEKYRQAIAEIKMTPEEFSASYSVAIRVTPKHLRGY